MRSLLILLFAAPIFCLAQPATKNIKLGAYYFDGWTGKTNHISRKLIDSFPDRKPIWGWETSTAQIMPKQIDYAADAGIDFFDFCWYYSDLSRANKAEPRNNALGLFLVAKNNSRLKFDITVINHEGYTLGAAEWPTTIKIWIDLMKNPSYLKVDNKPLINFFSVDRLIDAFGSVQAVKTAIDQLKSEAAASGLGDITVGACIYPSTERIAQAKLCGFNLLTSYSLAAEGFKGSINSKGVGLDSLNKYQQIIWNKYLPANLPVIPVVTLNFDPRPWGDIVPNYAHPKYYAGFSPASVYRSIAEAKKWLLDNDTHTEKVAVIYAWNENGEGAWLTPSAKFKNKLLENVKRARN